MKNCNKNNHKKNEYNARLSNVFNKFSGHLSSSYDRYGLHRVRFGVKACSLTVFVRRDILRIFVSK